MVGVSGGAERGERAQLSSDRPGVNMAPSLLWSSLSLILLHSITADAVKLSQDGSYSGLTVSIEESVSEENCDVILQNIKVRALSI